MGVMNNLRENTGVILWILVFAFGVIWVLQDSGGLDAVGNLSNNIGTVNGDVITVDEYNQAVDQQVQSYQNQTGESMPPQMLDQARDRVFNQLVDSKLREQEMERLGLDVSDAELIEMIEGADPHPIIKAYFSDGQGGVDRALLQNFISNPEATADWLQIEAYIRSERRGQKLENLIGASVRVTEADVNEENYRQNASANVRYVSLRYSALPDTEISYDESDLKRFYNEHKEEFESKKTFDLSYVTLSKAPTKEDTATVFSDLSSLAEAFGTAEDDSLFLSRNGSERPFTDAYFRQDELDETIATLVFAGSTEGQVLGPIISGNQVHLIKVRDIRPPEETAVKASHILFRAAEGDDEARAAARTKANDVLARLRNGDDFAAMAREFSDDGSASSGGELGWFGPGRMVAPFEEAAFAATVDRVVGPVSTQFGFHLIKVTERATEEAQIADFALSLRASVQTLNRAQSALDDLQYYASEEGGFTEESARRELTVQTVSVEDEQAFVPGLGNSRSLVTFMETAKVGDVTPVIELNDVFVVAVVDKINKAGFRPFEEVKDQLEPRLRNEMKAKVQVQKLMDALGSGFDGLATATASAEQTAEGLSFSNMIVPGIGRDPKFVGTAIGMAVGSTSSVFEGENSAYVIMVTELNEPDPLQPEMYSALYEQLKNQRQNLVRSQWITSLRESADIVDNRRLFLQ
ncbi:peptidylprolyl isomerase [bacterium]|nr:peptidylprolyl isomerase [bacterium]